MSKKSLTTLQFTTEELREIYERIDNLPIGSTWTFDLSNKRVTVQGYADLNKAYEAALFVYRMKQLKFILETDITKKIFLLHLYL